MPTPYTGHVVFDDDENHRWHVHIDDLDSADWTTEPIRPPMGAEVPDDGTEIRVTLADGQHVGRHAKAWYRGERGPFLRGVSAFEPPA
jgi:hypothetical protein